MGLGGCQFRLERESDWRLLPLAAVRASALAINNLQGGFMNGWRNRVYWKACDASKIRRRRLHDTRHTFASLLLNNGESLKYVSTQLRIRAFG